MNIHVKTFFLMAVICFVMAIIINFAAKQKYSDVSMHRAIITQSGESNTVVANDDAYVGDLMEVISGCFAVLGVVFWISSAVRKEQCRHSILIVLFVFFMLLLFTFV